MSLLLSHAAEVMIHCISAFFAPLELLFECLGVRETAVRHTPVRQNEEIHTIMSKPHLVERLDHGILVRGVDVGGTVALAQPEDRLDD